MRTLAISFRRMVLFREFGPGFRKKNRLSGLQVVGSYGLTACFGVQICNCQLVGMEFALNIKQNGGEKVRE
jgi:hypothetical protein